MGPDPIEERDLNRVMDAARYAPNAGNRRLQFVQAITDPATIALLRAVAPGMLPTPPAIIVVGIDQARAAEYGFRPDAPGLFIDVGTMAATLLLAAHAVGLPAFAGR
jgi:nitroreductase